MSLTFECICGALESCSLSKNVNVFHNDFFIILLGCVFQPFTFGLVISFSLICAASEIVHPDINVLRTLFGYRNFFKIWMFSKSVTIFTFFHLALGLNFSFNKVQILLYFQIFLCRLPNNTAQQTN